MFTKKTVIVILAVSISWVYLSFILAFMGKEQIAESIATTAITSIIATFFAYALKSLFEKRDSFGGVGKPHLVDGVPTHIQNIVDEEIEEEEVESEAESVETNEENVEYADVETEERDTQKQEEVKEKEVETEVKVGRKKKK